MRRRILCDSRSYHVVTYRAGKSLRTCNGTRGFLRHYLGVGVSKLGHFSVGVLVTALLTRMDSVSAGSTGRGNYLVFINVLALTAGYESSKRNAKKSYQQKKKCL